MLDQIEFLCSEALTALRRNVLMTVAAITTAAVALFLLGGLAYVYYRVQGYATEVSSRFEMRVWLKDGLNEAAAREVSRKVQGIDGVKNVTFVSREVEWKRFSVQQPEMTKGIENVLPHSLRVTLDTISKADDVEGKVKQIQSVGLVVYLRDEKNLMEQLLSIMRWAGGALGTLLFITSGILIYNAIRLTIFARRREIRIMQLVGASTNTIRAPFLIEGAVQGMVGGLLAASLIGSAQVGFQGVVNQVVAGQTFPAYPWLPMSLVLMLVGGVFGVLCSTWAIRSSLSYSAGVTA